MRFSTRAKPQGDRTHLTRGERPAPLLEVLSQRQPERHTGVGFELVLDPVVPQMAEQLVEVVDLPVQGGVGLRGGLQGPGPGQGLTVQVGYISPAPAVFLSPAPVVEYSSPVMAVFQTPAPVGGVHKQEDGDGLLQNIVEDLGKESRRGLRNGLREFSKVNNERALDVGALRRGTFKVRKQKVPEGCPDVIVRENSNEVDIES